MLFPTWFPNTFFFINVAIVHGLIDFIVAKRDFFFFMLCELIYLCPHSSVCLF